MLLRIAAASLLALLVACGSDAIDIRPAAPDPLIAAVDAFVSAGRSPEAYAELAATAAAVPASPRTEARLLVLALAPVQAVQARPVAAQAEALALTVWPTLLGTAAAERGETAASYLLRLCSGALAEACHRVVPELQSAVVRAIAMHRAATRVRSAVAACLPCASEPAWHEAVLAWEELDRAAQQTSGDTLRRADPDSWPMAGAMAEADAALPEAEITERGGMLVGDRDYGSDRVAVLRELRRAGEAIALHVHPGASVAQLRAILADAHRAGCRRVAITAREPVYPWARRSYWLTDATSLPVADSLAHVLRGVDARAGIARAE